MEIKKIIIMREERLNSINKIFFFCGKLRLEKLSSLRHRVEFLLIFYVINLSLFNDYFPFKIGVT